MSLAHDLCVVAAAVGSGMVAGLCFAFGSFILPSFDQLGAPRAIRAMQAINVAILRSSAMVVWFGTLFAGLVSIVLAEDRWPVILATLLYALGAVAITGRRNVPLNDRLARADPGGEDAEEAWGHYSLQWRRWNALRTAACACASVAFTLGL